VDAKNERSENEEIVQRGKLVRNRDCFSRDNRTYGVTALEGLASACRRAPVIVVRVRRTATSPSIVLLLLRLVLVTVAACARASLLPRLAPLVRVSAAKRRATSAVHVVVVVVISSPPSSIQFSLIRSKSAETGYLHRNTMHIASQLNTI